MKYVILEHAAMRQGNFKECPFTGETKDWDICLEGGGGGGTYFL